MIVKFSELKPGSKFSIEEIEFIKLNVDGIDIHPWYNVAYLNSGCLGNVHEDTECENS